MANANSFKPVASILGAAFVSTLVAVPFANAQTNPFGMTALSSGYTVAAADSMDSHMPAGASKAGEGMCGMKKLDTNGDGKISKEEFMSHMESMFAMMDTNKDGTLDKEEFAKMREGKCGGKMGGDHMGDKGMSGMGGMGGMHKEKTAP
ncbi:MAG: EF-hand domain-containing protein [Gammaproteobacteria bacterium]